MINRGMVGALIVLALVSVAGCSDDPPPAPASVTGTTIPRESSPPPPSTSSSPSPTLPAAATQPTRAGAEAFASYFFAVYNYAFWILDPAPLTSISDEGCIYCKSTVEAVGAVRSRHAHVEGGRIEVATAVAAPGTPSDRIVVNLILKQDAVRTVASDGTILDDSPAVRNGRVDIAVRWVGGHWTLLDAHLLKDGE